MQKKTRSKVKPLVAAYAISLRKEGKQYKEIVELCNQIDKSESITLDWCKRNLKLVEKEVVTPEGKLEAICLEQIKALATLPKGITSSECKRIIKHNHKLEDAEEIYKLYKKYKTKLLSNEPKAFFRPSCLQPNRAEASFKKILTSGNYIYDVVADYVSDICQEYTEVYADAVRRELASLIFPELKLMGGAQLRMQHLEHCVEKLKQRVKQQECVVQEPMSRGSFYIDEDELPY